MHNTEPPIGQDAAGQATAQQPPAGRRMYWLAGLRVNSSSGTTAMTSTMSGLRVDPSNAGQAKAWDGGEGTNWAAHAGHLDRTVAGYHLRFLEAAAVRAGEWVLDIGCGTGQVTRDAARRAVPAARWGGPGAAPRRLPPCAPRSPPMRTPMASSTNPPPG